MTTVVLTKDFVASDRCVIDYCNHSKGLHNKSATSDSGAVSLALVGKEREDKELVQLANLCEALEQASVKSKKDDSYESHILPIMQKIEEILRGDKIYIIYMCDGDYRACVGEAGDTLTFNHLIKDAVVTAGTGRSSAELEYCWQRKNGALDLKALFEFTASHDLCTSKEYDVHYSEDLTDVMDTEIDYEELLK